MFVLHCPDVICGHCCAGLHCLLRHGKQRVVTLADILASKATGGIIHHLTIVVYLIYQVMWSLRKIQALPSPGKWLYLAFPWPYWRSGSFEIGNYRSIRIFIMLLILFALLFTMTWLWPKISDCVQLGDITIVSDLCIVTWFQRNSVQQSHYPGDFAMLHSQVGRSHTCLACLKGLFVLYTKDLPSLPVSNSCKINIV